MKKPLFCLLFALVAWLPLAHAQDDGSSLSLSDMIAAIPDSTCTITDIGVVAGDLEVYVKTDSLTGRTDTLRVLSRPSIVWQTEGCDVFDSVSVANARQARGVRKKAPTSDVVSQYGQLMGMFQNFYYYVFSFNYMSVDFEGKPIVLSAMAACPPKDGPSEVNNIIIGTHITITSDAERPSSRFNNFAQDDWGMLMSMAAGPKFLLTAEYSAALVGASAASALLAIVPVVGPIFLAASIAGMVFSVDQVDKAWGYHAYNSCLVIMPDYEGYGVSRERAHPYLYQELTARQCVDATLTGIKLYQSDELTKYLRHPLRKNYRTMSCGYSQGGSVAMAVHRFVEQNNLDKTLHFSGSYCGDGPYDPMATLMYYVHQEKAGKPMSMSVVLPLIVKGMLDTNPYMKGHTADQYFRPEFLATGIMDWLASKDYSTGGIDSNWKQLHAKDPSIKDYANARLTDIMNDECYAYFSKVYEANMITFTSSSGIPKPSKRGVMEDLHLALSSNDMLSGWQPRHTVYLFHSEGDTVVPYVNAQRAKNALGSGCSLETAPNGLDHVDTGTDFFRGDSNIGDVVFERTLNLRLFDKVGTICSKSY